jgi:hypothetical protein
VQSLGADEVNIEEPGRAVLWRSTYDITRPDVKCWKITRDVGRLSQGHRETASRNWLLIEVVDDSRALDQQSRERVSLEGRDALTLWKWWHTRRTLAFRALSAWRGSWTLKGRRQNYVIQTTF